MVMFAIDDAAADGKRPRDGTRSPWTLPIEQNNRVSPCVNFSVPFIFLSVTQIGIQRKEKKKKQLVEMVRGGGCPEASDVR